MKIQTKDKIRTITTVAIMSAVATVLMVLEFSVPLVPVFLKFDFANLPALLVSFAIGPWAGVAVEFIRNLLHLPFSHTFFAGELANFIMSSAFILSAGLIYRCLKTRKGAIIASVSGAVASAIISLPVNYYVSYPVYFKVFAPEEVILDMYKAILPSVHTLWEALLIFNLPFTFVKGIICALITFFIYKPLSPILKGKKKGKTE